MTLNSTFCFKFTVEFNRALIRDFNYESTFLNLIWNFVLHFDRQRAIHEVSILFHRAINWFFCFNKKSFHRFSHLWLLAIDLYFKLRIDALAFCREQEKVDGLSVKRKKRKKERKKKIKGAKKRREREGRIRPKAKSRARVCWPWTINATGSFSSQHPAAYLSLSNVHACTCAWRPSRLALVGLTTTGVAKGCNRISYTHILYIALGY